MSAHPRLSLNQATIKYAPFDEALRLTAGAGYESIGLWREPVADVGLDEAARRLSDSGLRISSLCRGGFFTLPEGPERRAAGVTLAIEPLHPMYASDRAVVSTLDQALDIALQFGPEVGVVVDTFHIWWDPQVFTAIERAGATDRIASYQVCDWATPLPADVLLARPYPGDGVIDFSALTRAVDATGYTGDIEVEIFNETIWDDAWPTVVSRTASSFADVVAPHLSVLTT